MIKQSEKLVIFALTCLILIGPVMCSLDQYDVVYCIKCVCQVCGNKHYYREKFLNLIGIDLNPHFHITCVFVQLSVVGAIILHNVTIQFAKQISH